MSSPTESHERLLRGKTLAERRHERREALLDAALDLFGTKGYSNTTIEEICRAAYVSTRNFYEEFANREAVLIALGQRIAQQALHVLTTVEVEPGPGIRGRRTRARIAALVELLLRDPRVARLVFVESLGVSPEQEMRRREVHRTIAHWLADFTIEEALAQGRDARRQELQALAVVGACNELLSDWVLSDDRSSLEELVDLLVDVVLDMLPAPQTER